MTLGVGFEVSKDLPHSQCASLPPACGSRSELSVVWLLHLCSIIMDSNPLEPETQLKTFFCKLSQ